MPTEMLEYRPGKWVKVVDGHIVGRATAEEVASWQAQAGRSARGLSTAASLVLDVDLGSPPPRQAEPAQALDVSARPAFERRGRPVPPAGPAPEPTAAGEAARPPRRTLEMAVPAGAPARPRERPSEPPDDTNTPAYLRRKPKTEAGRGEAAAKGRAERPAPTRRAPAAQPVPAAEATTQRPAEVTPLPKPEAAPPAAPAARRRPAPEVSESATAEPPAAEETPDSTTPAPGQGPAYWWIWNAHHQPVDAFLREWAARYRDKFGRPATFVLCHDGDLAAVQASGFDADASPLVQPGHFYLSHGDGETPPPAKKRGGT